METGRASLLGKKTLRRGDAEVTIFAVDWETAMYL